MTTITTSSSDAALRATDPVLADLLEQEDRRQSTTLTLIASENHCSRAVRAAVSSRVSDKYAEGYPGRRYYGGCEIVDKIEELARDRIKAVFGADHANVQPHSGTTANMAVLAAIVGPGGHLVGMELGSGGHLSHGHPVSHTGKLFVAAQYGVDPQTGLIDYDRVREICRQHHPRLLIAGGSSYARTIDYAVMAEIASEVGARLLADIAHPAGLIAAGVIPSPLPHADVVTMTTHKTLRGPRGGLVLCKEELAKDIDRALFPGAQGGPLVHQIAGKAVAFHEASTDDFKAYQQAVRDNATHLASRLLEAGLQIVTGGTDTHLVLVDLRGQDVSGADVEERARQAGISLNKNMVPGDPRKPRETSGIRVGTAAATTRGMGTAEMDVLAEVLVGLVRGEDPASHARRVAGLCEAFPLP